MSDEAAGAFKFGLPSGSDVESNAVSAMLTAATIVLCWYDHSLTLSREVKGFWKQRLSISSWLYFVNRYVTMICGLLLTVRLVTWAPQPPRMANQVCNIASMLTGVCKITIHLVFALFASIRTYAIWGKNTKILVCVLLLGLVYPIGYAYYTVCTTSSAAPPPLLGCLEYTNTPIKPICRTLLVLIALVTDFLGIGSTALFEGLAIALTWAKTVPDIYRARRNNHSSIFPMTHAIFYDGTLLFIVIIISNCAGLFAMAWPSLTVLFTFSDILGSLMTSRFLLDLREDYISKLPDGHWEDSSFHISDMSTIQFNFTLEPYDSDESFVLSNIESARI